MTNHALHNWLKEKKKDSSIVQVLFIISPTRVIYTEKLDVWKHLFNSEQFHSFGPHLRAL